MIPILLWNAIFANRLPPQFLPEIFDNVPVWVKVGENILRAAAFMMPLFFSMGISTQAQKQGLVWYTAGTLIYFLAWVPLLFYPGSAWCMSLPGFLAPAYTPLFWMIGIGLLGDGFYFPLRYQPATYIVPAVLFLCFHITHTTLVYLKNF